MRTIKIKCECCGELYEALVTSTCTRSCGALKRERQRKDTGKKIKTINTAIAFNSFFR